MSAWHKDLRFTPPPSEWRYDQMGAIWCPSAKGGERKLFEIRGWGYLTGQGHGALALSFGDAREEQDILATFVIDACQLHAVTPDPREELRDKIGGLLADLDSALGVLWRRGDDEAREWCLLNYPEFARRQA